MSEIADQSQVTILVSDFASSDQGGKMNIIGAGIGGLGFDPTQGLTSRFTLSVIVHVPSALTPAEFPVEMSLVDSAGELVVVPGPPGVEGRPIRVGQLVQAESPPLVFNQIQRERVGARLQIVFDFGNGLPLLPGGMYEWRVRIDGDDSSIATYPLAVAGGQPGPVIG